MLNFKSYSVISILTTIGVITNAIQKNETFFNTVVDLTSQKINLVVFFNFLLIILINLGLLYVWLFFDHIRSIESKYLMDKSQKKIFHFLLLTLILRSTFDVYKFISLTVLLFFWIIHWLVYKRSDYLVSRGSRGKMEHFKLLVVYNSLIIIDFVVSYIFYDKFQIVGEKMNEIYVIIGFEFVRLFLKSVQDSFKYIISLIELYYREQWTEKGFVFNIISFIFDFIVLLLNIKLFTYIISRQQFPLYLLGEIIDTFVRLGKSIQLFIQSRQLINKLKRLPDVSGEDLVGMDNTCIICLEEIHKAKKLKCGHIFHLNCLRRWLEQNIQCPTCRDKIELDFTSAESGPGRDREQQRINVQRVQNLRRRRIRLQMQANEGGEEIKEDENQNQDDNQSELQQKNLEQQMIETDKLIAEMTKKAINDRAKTIEDKDKKKTPKELLKIEEDEIFIDMFKNEISKENLDDQQLADIIENLASNIVEGTLDHKEQASDQEESPLIEEVKQEEKPNKKYKSGKDELKFAQTLNKTLFEARDGSSDTERKVEAAPQTFYQNPYDLRFGSIPYGLPCIALTRRTLDVQLKNKQIELINDKICKILKQPSDYVEVKRKDDAVKV